MTATKNGAAGSRSKIPMALISPTPATGRITASARPMRRSFLIRGRHSQRPGDLSPLDEIRPLITLVRYASATAGAPQHVCATPPPGKGA